jgi:predicted regulator of Ras-like GTPase activity (Roadblock/LC7/MglB family)
MEKLLEESGAHGALLVDRAGQLLMGAGTPPGFDVTSFSTLAAADFSANDQLAQLLGETDFSSLFHQGERESMLLADIGGRAILVVMFDTSTTLGLVRLRLRSAVEALAALVHTMATRFADDHATRPALLAGAEDEIDQLFQ